MTEPAHRVARRVRARPGFTLVEILIVVAILGILAAMVVPRFGTASEETRQKVFAASLKQFVRVTQVYSAENEGALIADASSGVLPPELAAYIPESRWVGGTPIGGVWDAEGAEYAGVASAIGVHFNAGNAQSNDYMTRIDEIIDDGDLSTGMFRRFAADRFYFITATR